MYSMGRSSDYSSRPGWTGFEVLREVATFSLVLICIMVALVLLPQQNAMTHLKDPLSQRQVSNLEGISEVNVDEIGPWAAPNSSQHKSIFKMKSAQDNFISSITQQLQARGIKISHESSAPKLKLFVTYMDDEYAIRAPRNIKSLELELRECAVLARKQPHSEDLTTWSRTAPAGDVSASELAAQSAFVVNQFIEEVARANEQNGTARLSLH